MQKKWWLCNATDFQSLMYPCFTLCRIFGIFPYTINASNFAASKPRYILSSIVIYVCCVMNLILIYSIITSKLTFRGVIGDTSAVIYYALSTFIVIITHALSGPRMRMLQTIWEISSKLSPKSYKKLSRLIHIKDILSTIIKFVQLYITCPKSLEYSFSNFLIWVCSTYFTILPLQIIMMYINCVCILKTCFKEINNNLMHMQRFIINNMEPSVSRFICHVQRNQILLAELKILKKRHLMIGDAVQMLNTIFSLQLLATVVICFTIFTFELYFFAVHWQDGIFISLDRDFLGMIISAIINDGSVIMLLAWACETIKNQAQEIRTTIHDLLNNVKDEEIKYELFCDLTLQLQLFSLQILHQENIFSAKGFNIDATLLATMVGSITTYLVILIQFLNVSHSCDKTQESILNNNN